VARNPARYGGLIAFTGGLIGPPGSDLHHPGSLGGTVALLSSGDPDPHAPWERVEASARELKRMGAQVQLDRHPDRPHSILSEELNAAMEIIFSLLKATHDASTSTDKK
jgi:predicted esterase